MGQVFRSRGHGDASVSSAHFLFDWNVNARYRDIPLADYYPGNAYVDMVASITTTNKALACRPLALRPGGKHSQANQRASTRCTPSQRSIDKPLRIPNGARFMTGRRRKLRGERR